MKVAIVSDIHGNRPAFEAVLQDIPDSVNKIWCLGDIVGYNPWPSDCIRLVREHIEIAVQGNHDRKVGRFDQSQGAPTTLGEQNTAWTAEQVTEQAKQFLAELPAQRTIRGGRVVLSHSDPRYRDSYIFPEEAQNLDRYVDARPQVSLLAMGHTHIPFAERVSETLVINPGSVGQPRDGDKRAAYAVLDTAGNDVELRRVEYDINRVISRIEECGLPTQFGARLLDGL